MIKGVLNIAPLHFIINLLPSLVTAMHNESIYSENAYFDRIPSETIIGSVYLLCTIKLLKSNFFSFQILSARLIEIRDIDSL